MKRTDNVKAAIGQVLEFKWTTSRAPETYGYTICSLRSRGELLGRCNGGGYDLKGTSFGQWVEKRFQDELMTLAKGKGAFDVYNSDTAKWERVPTDNQYRGSGAKYYGATLTTKNGKRYHVSLDGACGIESMIKILNALGLDLKFVYEQRHVKVYEVIEHKPCKY